MWSNERNNEALKNAIFMPILCKTVSPMLATSPGSNEVYSKYIAANSPDAKSMMEEIELHGQEEVERQGTTRFIRGFMYQDPGNVNPYKWYDKANEIIEPVPTGCTESRMNLMWDYQLGGFFKEKISMLQRASEKAPKAKTKAEKLEQEFIQDAASDFKASASKKKFACSDLKAYKKVVDGLIKVKERKIPLIFPEKFFDDERGSIDGLDPNGLPWVYQRSLRAETAQGPRVTLASSEVAPVGTLWSCTIVVLDPVLVPVVKECLDFGQYVGMLQNRGNGYGRFIWTPIDPTTGAIVD